MQVDKTQKMNRWTNIFQRHLFIQPRSQGFSNLQGKSHGNEVVIYQLVFNYLQLSEL